MEYPKAAITAKVPTSDTGIARIGVTAARQVPRKSSTTATTRPTASIIVWITASMDSSMNSVVL